MNPRRSELWLVDFGEPVGREQAGRRPAVIVSSDLLNEGPAGVVIVVPCTTTFRGLPSHIELDPLESGLDEVSFAKSEDVKSVSDHRLIARIGRVPSTAMFDLDRALRFLMEL